MKQMKRTPNIYKSKNNLFDAEKVEAFSYNWWQFVRKIKGKVVFNQSTYSMTTCKHQREVASLMRRLKINVDVYVYGTAKGLQNNDFLTEAMTSAYRDLFLADYTLARKGLSQKTMTSADDQKTDATKRIKGLRSIGGKLSKKDQSSIRREVEQCEISRLKEAREIGRKKRKAIKALKGEIDSLEPVSLLVDKIDDTKAIGF